MTQHEKDLSLEQRRERIAQLVAQQGKARVAELAERFAISEVSIRTDLADLESLGLLQRTHGGAISTARAYYNMTFDQRLRTNEPIKQRIAERALEFLGEGDTVIFNSGTTTLFAAQQLRDIKKLVVLTNSLPIAMAAGHFAGVSMILLGGMLNEQYQYVYGNDAIEQIRRYKADHLILSVDGVDAKEGLTTYHYMEAELMAAMMERASEVIVVADHTKIGSSSFARIAPLERVARVITDQKADPSAVAALRAAGLEVAMVS